MTSAELGPGASQAGEQYPSGEYPAPIINPMAKFSWRNETKRVLIIVALGLLALAGTAYFVRPDLFRRGEIPVTAIDRIPAFNGRVNAIKGDSITVEGTAAAPSDTEPKTEMREFELNPETEFFVRQPEKGQLIAQYERPASRAALKIGGWVMIYTKATFKEQTNTLRLPSAQGIKIIVDRVSILQ